MLPTENTDILGNHYYGWRNNFFLGDYRTNYTTDSEIVAWINSSLGQTCAALTRHASPGGTGFSLILPHPQETLPLPIIATDVANTTGPTPPEPSKREGFRARFDHLGINSSNTTVSAGSQVIPYSSALGGSLGGLAIGRTATTNVTKYVYACLNESSLSIAVFPTDGTNLVDINSSYFLHVGWLKEGLYEGINGVLNCCYIMLRNGESITRSVGIGGLSVPQSGVTRHYRTPPNTGSDSIAEYPINCGTITPGADTTDFVLREHLAPHRAIGIADNLLLSTLPLTLGGYYKNLGVDPDENNNPYWLAVAKYGANRTVLMRAWAQGLANS
jgi:hypothetical protein